MKTHESRLTDICSYYLVVQQDWEFALKNAVLKSAFSQHLSYIWNSSDGIRETDVPVLISQTNMLARILSEIMI